MWRIQYIESIRFDESITAQQTSWAHLWRLYHDDAMAERSRRTFSVELTVKSNLYFVCETVCSSTSHMVKLKLNTLKAVKISGVWRNYLLNNFVVWLLCNGQCNTLYVLHAPHMRKLFFHVYEYIFTYSIMIYIIWVSPKRSTFSSTSVSLWIKCEPMLSMTSPRRYSKRVDLVLATKKKDKVFPFGRYDDIVHV